MGVYKCKMCGGTLEVTDGSSIITCEFCGTTQTVHSFDDEKKVNLFSRANELRFRHEFDKASGIYESIVAEFPHEAEAYWGLLLCKYGIDYVDDDLTGKKIPTCNRTSFDSILNDPDYQNVIKYADVISRDLYEAEAKKIEDIRKNILKISSQENPYDIFICFKDTDDNKERTEDSVLAQDIYDVLSKQGYRIFFSRITLEDKLGAEFEPYIFSALYSSKILIHVTKSVKNSEAVWVVNEWSRFLDMAKEDSSKLAFLCFEDINPSELPDRIKGLQSIDMSKLGATQDVVRFINKYFKDIKKEEAEISKESSGSLQGDYNLLIRKGFRFLETGSPEKANNFFEQSIGVVDKCGEAYFGQLLVSWKLRSIKDAKELDKLSFLETDLFKNAKKYASVEFSKTILEIEHSILNNNHKKHYSLYKEQIEKSDSPSEVYKAICLLSDFINKSIENNNVNGTKIDLFDGEIDLTYNGCLRLGELLLEQSNEPEDIFKIDYALDMLSGAEITEHCNTSQMIKKLNEKKAELIKEYDLWCLDILKSNELINCNSSFNEKFNNFKDVLWKYKQNIIIFESLKTKDEFVTDEFNKIQERLLEWIKNNTSSLFESIPDDYEIMKNVVKVFNSFNELDSIKQNLVSLEERMKLKKSKSTSKRRLHGLFAFLITVGVLGLIVSLSFILLKLL